MIFRKRKVAARLSGSPDVPAFFVTSYGRTATYWLAAMLNSHPDIYCTHGPTLKRLVGAPNDPPVEHTSEVFRDQDQYYGLRLDEMSRQMQRQHGARIYGNVHAFTAMRLQNKIKDERYPHMVTRANLLRHPVTRLDSYTKHCIKQSYDDSHMRDSFSAFVDKHSAGSKMQQMIHSRYGVDFSLVANKMFVLAVIMLGNDMSDTQVQCPQVPYERLVSDIEYFQWFVWYISNGEATITDQMLAEFRTAHRKNAANAMQMTSLEIIRKWAKWQVYLLRFCLESTPAMQRLYRELQYDIDCVFDGADS